MKRTLFLPMLLATTAVMLPPHAWAGQAPGASSDPDVPVSHRDRVYTADQWSNTITVTDPVDNKLLGVITIKGLRKLRRTCRLSKWKYCDGVEGTVTWMFSSALSWRNRSSRALECSGPCPS